MQLFMEGIIEKVFVEKGFGFIKADGHEKGIFFHASSVEGIDFEQLREGDNVEFELTETPKGLNASNVTKL
jgi:CspA family cold shock protein